MKPKRTTNKLDLRCLRCGINMAAAPDDDPAGPGGWKKGPVIHCQGSQISFGSRWKGIDHHGHVKYFCRVCKRDLGCDYCAQRPSELVCTACHDWGMDAGEKEHGKMIKDRVAIKEKVGELIKTAYPNPLRHEP